MLSKVGRDLAQECDGLGSLSVSAVFANVSFVYYSVQWLSKPMYAFVHWDDIWIFIFSAEIKF